MAMSLNILDIFIHFVPCDKICENSRIFHVYRYITIVVISRENS